MGNLRVGKVSYLNTLPLFYSLKGFEITEGHPAELVKALREGRIDAGIVSSVEYFFNPEDYYVIPEVSISSRGRVRSVLLLSKKPLNEIERIRITPNSLTSRYLLLYLFKEVYRKDVEEVAEDEDAFLCIGDEALGIGGEFTYSYDLGEEWYRGERLPFVFALFLVRRSVPPDLVRKLHRSLIASLESFFKDLERDIVSLPERSLKDYFLSCIDYSLSDEHLRSLRRFFSFMERLTGKPSPEVISLFPL